MLPVHPCKCNSPPITSRRRRPRAPGAQDPADLRDRSDGARTGCVRSTPLSPTQNSFGDSSLLNEQRLRKTSSSAHARTASDDTGRVDV
ncbi:hypothetical protein EVAR_75242_1 [Eumeta japonica]|uniref:Uncharacterized protein n=1 Tax=Eumeta variegata TaxID=151549 RepID=A0A4C1V8K8_EUMVA|nr:hypothetical protein EVAR_75242_1 [Eumeta japonica]